MKTNSQFINLQRIIRLSLFILCYFIGTNNISANFLKTEVNIFSQQEKEDEVSLIISGILVDEAGSPLKGKSVQVYIAKSETTVDTHKDEPKKAGIGKQIKGTGTLNMSIEGVEGGGALKMIDGKIINPKGETDETGFFELHLSTNFILGESELLITVDYRNFSTYVTKSYPIVNKEGNPIFIKIDEVSTAVNLGLVRTIKE